jgi:hypothetical protein
MAKNRNGLLGGLLVVGALAGLAIAGIIANYEPGPVTEADRIDQECKRQFGLDERLVTDCAFRTTIRSVIEDREKRYDDASRRSR